MKVLRVILPLLVIGGILVFSMSCGKGNASATPTTQTVSAKTGDITIAVTGTGNLALAKTEDLSFEMAGAVKDVLVRVGDSVTQGQQLATLDTADQEDQIKNLQKTLDNAQHNLDSAVASVTKAQSNVTKAESNVDKAKSNVDKMQKGVTTAQDAVTKAQNNEVKTERQVTVKQLAVQQAQLDAQGVQDNLNNISDVKTAQDAVDKAQYDLDLARNSQLGAATRGDPTEGNFWRQQVQFYQAALDSAKKTLQDILTGTSTHLTSDVALQVAKAQLQVKQSQMALEDANTAVTDAQNAVLDAQKAIDNARSGVVDAQKAVSDAQDAVTDAQDAVSDAKTGVTNAQYNQKQAEEAVADAKSNLADAQALNPVIKAPFAGLITAVKVNGGDQVQKGKIAFTIADPNQFEANIMVNENDLFSLRTDQNATVEVDALSGMSFPATITAIAPTATVQQGVVNYQVTVALTSSRPTFGGSFASTNGTGFGGLRPGASGIPSGGLPTSLPPGFTPRASGSGRTFPANLPPGANGSVSGNLSDRAAALAAQAQNMTLKAGLSVTVNIVTQQKTGVLTIPSRAITRQGGNATVQKIKGDTSETVPVTTGLTDGTNTEITSGLSENDKVLVKTSTSSSSSNNGNRNIPFGGGGAIRIP